MNHWFDRRCFSLIIDIKDLKDDLDKYIRLCATEEIIIASNGTKVARLSAYEENDTGNACYLGEQAGVYEVRPWRASYEEFLALTENNEERYEYIDGEIYLMASPKAYHQETLGELFGVFYNCFKGKKCRPMLAPFDITLKRFAGDINVVQPDLMVICDLKERLNEKDYYMGVPALVVEIVSESTCGKDYINKLSLYMSTGVREYWIVNPLNREVLVYVFEEGDAAGVTMYRNNDTVVSRCFPGLEAAMDEIFP